MVTIVAYRETGWGDTHTDFRQWSNLCRAYGVDLLHVDDWHEVEPLEKPVVVLDQTGTTRLEDFTHPSDCTYVFGRTGISDLPTFIPHTASVRIETPQPIAGMFGVSVAGAVLFDRMLKNR